MLIGLTGGIGSGKTAAANHFESLGIDIVDADLASRAVVEPGQPALDSIAEHFDNQTREVAGLSNSLMKRFPVVYGVLHLANSALIDQVACDRAGKG